jgi:hypothetical protein
MDTKKERFECELPGGKKFELVELTIADELATLRTVKEAGSTTVGIVEMQHDLLRRTIASIGGSDVKYSDLDGGKLYEKFTRRELSFVLLAYEKVNAGITKQEADDFLKTLKAKG